MTEDEWARASVHQKLDWIRDELRAQNDHTNRVSVRVSQVAMRLAELDERQTRAALPNPPS